MKQVKQEEKQIEHIKATFNSKANKELQDKVKLVYAECHRDRDHGDPLTLQMLTAIEGTLEELLTVLDELDAFDPELVLRLEKIKEKERREEHTLFGVYLGKDGIPHTEPPDIP